VIRWVLRLSLVGFAVGWVLDTWLRTRVDGDEIPPIDSLVVIDAPIERVWATLADIEGQPRWMADMKDVRLTTTGPIGVGTRGEATVRILGLAVTDPITVTEFDPPTRFAVRHEGAYTGSGVFELEAGADGSTTIVRWTETLAAPILPHLAARVGFPVLSTVFQTDLERLRSQIESGPEPGTPSGAA
jgi:uncharacterized protein YndB with AHSA1/START domain